MCVFSAILIEFGLYGFPSLGIDNRRVIGLIELAIMVHFAQVQGVFEKRIEHAPREGLPALDLVLGRPWFAAVSVGIEFSFEFAYTA